MSSTAFTIAGGAEVTGEVSISGSKNAALALIAAALLGTGESTLSNVPCITDIDSLGRILSHLGVVVTRADTTLRLDTTALQCRDVPHNLTGELRASVLVLGALMARFGYARIGHPGGCKLGKRSIDEHLRGLRALGARVQVDGDVVEASAPTTGLRGAVVRLQTPTVLGTENLMLAACLARGTTHICNAAREPEVVDLAQCLGTMGARVMGAGTRNIVIQGREQLQPFRYRVMADRIEAGTFLVLGAMCGNPLRLHGCEAEHQTELIRVLRDVGAVVDVESRETVVVHRAMNPRAVDVDTGPYASFPTDLQPQLMALLATARGTSRITETMFEKRFNQVPGLTSMGADISVQGQVAVIRGVQRLSGSLVDAADLRAGVSLVLAAITAHGLTVIQGAESIDRGYHALQDKLAGIGVSMWRRPGA